MATASEEREGFDSHVLDCLKAVVSPALLHPFKLEPFHGKRSDDSQATLAEKLEEIQKGLDEISAEARRPFFFLLAAVSHSGFMMTWSRYEDDPMFSTANVHGKPSKASCLCTGGSQAAGDSVCVLFSRTCR